MEWIKVPIDQFRLNEFLADLQSFALDDVGEMPVPFQQYIFELSDEELEDENAYAHIDLVKEVLDGKRFLVFPYSHYDWDGGGQICVDGTHFGSSWDAEDQEDEEIFLGDIDCLAFEIGRSGDKLAIQPVIYSGGVGPGLEPSLMTIDDGDKYAESMKNFIRKYVK